MINSKLGKKIFAFMLMIMITVCAVLFAVAYYDMKQLQTESVQMSKEMGENSASVVSEGIVKQMNSAIMQVTVAKAENHDNEFKRVETNIKELCHVISHEYTYPNENFRFIPMNPLETGDGILMGRSAVAKRVEITDEIIDEQKSISQIEPYAAAIYEGNPIIMNVMIGTKSGIFYRYSDYNRYDEDYDVNTRIWYTNAMENPGKVVWSDAYKDAYGKYVVTVSSAYMNDSGEYVGVIASDIQIQSLLDTVLINDKVAGGYAFILDNNGTYLAYPGMKAEGFDKNPTSDGNPEKQQIIKQMVAGGTGKASFKKDGEDMYIFYAPIKTTGWSFALVVPNANIVEPADASIAVIEEGAEKNQQEISEAIREMVSAFIFIFIIILLILMVAAYQFSISIIRPVTTMVEGTEEIGKGNLDHVIDIKGDDELAYLGSSINKMSGELKNYITELTEVTAERQRIGAELNVATAIQENMLPKIFPKFSSHEYFALAASMHPAKEVGGDFYDFFMVDDDRFAMVIADVSGKGVPAALFMVISKTLIKSRALMGGSVSEILESVNEQLCEANGTDMFVTVLLGIINIKTGHMEYANAGHEYPIIKRAGGEYYANTEKHSFIIGGMEGIKYKKFEVDLNEGDVIFTYTDGIPEAHNTENEMFGMDRTLQTLNNNIDLEPDELIEKVKDEVMEFAGEAPQFDDMTMLCYKQLKTV